MTAAGIEPDGTATERIYAAIAALAGVLAVVEALRSTPWTIALVLVALVPWLLLVLGRSLPLWLFAVLALVPVIPVILLNHAGVVTFLTTAAASRVAARSDDRRFVLAVTALVLVVPFLPAVRGDDLWQYGAPYFAFGNLFGVLIGVLLRRANRLAADLRAADARLAEAAVQEERQRIARDVHDLVAHSLTVVVLHIGGARRVLRADPRAAEAALADAERVCREALDGIRGVVGLLRQEDDRPGVSLDLEQLAASYRIAGRTVALRVDGDATALPLAVRVALYRVVQEALANAARHSRGDDPIDVRVAADAASASARISNPLGRGPAAPSTGGYGLVGLREQVAALGGRLTGQPEDGTWVVECRIPLGVPAVAGGAA
ncbi:MAG TPA: histidine kinase [Amnibacterium sp.]